jgi:hypothetical protein
LDGAKVIIKRARENIGLLEIQEGKSLLIKAIIFPQEDTTNISWNRIFKLLFQNLFEIYI